MTFNVWFLYQNRRFVSNLKRNPTTGNLSVCVFVNTMTPNHNKLDRYLLYGNHIKHVDLHQISDHRMSVSQSVCICVCEHGNSKTQRTKKVKFDILPLYYIQIGIKFWTKYVNQKSLSAACVNTAQKPNEIQKFDI